MNKNGFILLGIIMVIIIGIIYFTMDTPTTPTPVEPNTVIPTESVSTSTTSVVTATSTATSTPSSTASTTKTYTIIYTETGFSPADLTIKAGETIVFKNNSARAFWPASNDHPSHTIYPEFDPKKTVAAGASWSFTFTKIGNWKYHDHRAANLGGTITVQ
jgi:plastocyanin